jgi:inosose dehydratase
MERSNKEEAETAMSYRADTTSDDRIGAGPISWGVCEVPGWGTMLPADRVLGEMVSLGIHATELGAPGFLPRDASPLRDLLDRHGVRLIGGFVPLVLHEPEQRERAIRSVTTTAAMFAEAGATMLVSAAVVDERWAPRSPLSNVQWDHLIGMLDILDEVCADVGLAHALHPHVGTLVQNRDEVQRLIDASSVRWCLDTGHLTIGGYDPVQFAADTSGRVAHVHLKDVRADLAAGVASNEVNLIDAVRCGLFQPLGQGTAPIAATVEQLEIDQYRGWYVLEQDTDLGDTPPAPGEGPISDVRQSIDYLREVLAGQRTG